MDARTDFNTFLEICNAPTIGKNILNADNIQLSDDDIYKFTKDLWWEVMNNNDSQESLVSFEEFMEAIQRSNKDFSYTILRNDDLTEVTGCLWMTSTMRKNFELFGSSICVDAMKRDINKMGMPYIAVTMHNEMNKVCVGCEGIVISEKEEAYVALLDFQTTYSRRKKNEIYAVAADGFLSQEFLERNGFENARFVLDYYHLFNDILPKKFGNYFRGIEPYLRNMAHAYSATKCEQSYMAALNYIKENTRYSEKDVNLLKDFYAQRENYALFHLHSIRGLRGKRGSTASESNHSSVLFHLNDGERIKNQYCEHPTTLFRDLIKRADEHIVIGNEQLNNEREMLICEKRNIQLTSEHDNIELLKASDVLCYKSFLRFKDNVKKANLYYFDKNNLQVIRINHVDSDPRCFFRNEIGEYSRCNCKDAIQYQEQCVHEIVLHHYLFKKELFDQWHYRRDYITSSPLPDELRQESIMSESTSSLVGSPIKNNLIEICDSLQRFSNGK